MPEVVQVPPSQPATVFVGREREMALLRAALADATAGHGRLVLLAGEPGIGKTRLAEELAGHAAAEGAPVRWGRCREGAGAPAFWPWMQVLRAQIREANPEELRAQLGCGAEEIVRLVPGLHERVPGLAAAPLADDAGARFRLFDSVVGFLRASAAAQPLVLILEDLHWAQASAVQLLRFLAEEMREARILVIATYRDIDVSAGHPLAEVLRAPSYPPRVQRIGLAGLNEDEIGQLIETLGHEGSATLAARIHRESGGNPFFATEIVRGLRTAGAGIPGSVRDAIGDRLSRLSEPCRRLLGMASVLGAEFDLGPLERIAAGTGVLPLLGEARDAHIVVEVRQGAGAYRFAHALIREVLYTGLPLEARLRLHWHVATALEALGGPSREHGASELAHHFEEAIAGCGEEAQRRACIDKAVQYATKAAEQATAMCAYEDATAHYEHALRVPEAWATDDTARLCELLLALGNAQRRAGAPYAVRSKTFHRAAALARERGETGPLVRAAVGLGTDTPAEEATDSAQAALLEEALGAVGTQDSLERARLLAYLAIAKCYPDPQTRSMAVSAEALAMARRIGDPRTVAFALRGSYNALSVPEYTEQRLVLATEMVQLGEQLGDREIAMWGRLCRLWAALELGLIATVEGELALFARLADELRQPVFRSRAVAVRAGLALLAGRFAEAEQLAREALCRMPHAQTYLAILVFAQQMGLVYWEQDRLEELEHSLKGAIAGASQTVPGSGALAAAYAARGHADEARAEIERLGADNFSGVYRIGRLGELALTAQACADIGDSTRAAALYQLLLPYASHLIVMSQAAVCLGSVSLFLGLLADTLGRCDDALRHLDEALAAHTRINSPPWIANTQWATAAVLLARNGPGDRERAAALLTEVLETTERLGMRRLQRKTLALQEQTESGTGAPHETASPALAVAEASPFERGGLRGISVNATFRKEGDYWVIGYKAPAFRLRDRIGLQYLAVLLRNPDREFLAIDLVAAVHGGRGRSASEAGLSRPSPATHVGRLEPGGLSPPSGPPLPRGDYRGGAVLGGGEPYFDEQARRQYSQRLRDLQEALEEAQAFNDRERASRTQAEVDLLTDELQKGIGLGRRLRASGSPVERARVSVTQAIKAALGAIVKNEAELGQYLAATIKTGTFCSYSPDRRVSVRWQL